ncbi:MAG: FAD:protein FMN transferase, partial [Anaeroplasmataceae bacterium]|nr:FAD:protein FMN transferase [Anaeroplasmataceae bacterium]
LFTTSCSQKEQKETYTFYAMDTFISLTFYNTENSEELARGVEDIYINYSNVADDFQSGISGFTVFDLNQKREGEISEELVELLKFSVLMQKETNGYYNPFIGRLSHLWKEALENKRLVETDIIQIEIEIMNQTSLEIEGLYVRLVGNGNVDLGGVAKGYATSKVKEYLDSMDCHSYLLNAGSSTIVLGNKNGDDFTVGLSKATASGYFEILKMKETSISTSSIKEQSVLIDGIRYSHLLNPKTGWPALFYDTVSIIGEDSKVLDAYSTALFAMDLEELKAFLEEKNLNGIVSKDNNTLYKSAGVESYA